MGFLELVQLKSVCKTKISYLTPLQHAQGYCKIFCQIQISLLVLHWSWHLTQTSMSIIYQNHLVIYFSRLLGFRHASATFCSGNFIGINMHDFFFVFENNTKYFSLCWTTTMFCVIMTNYTHSSTYLYTYNTTRVGFDGRSPSKNKQGYDIFSGTFLEVLPLRNWQCPRMRATNTILLYRVVDINIHFYTLSLHHFKNFSMND